MIAHCRLRPIASIGSIVLKSDGEKMPEFVDLCKVSDIPVGEAKMILVNEQAFGIFNVSGTFYALDNACPHGGASLSHGIIEGDVVHCRIHHWRFCIRNGIYLDENKPSCNVRSYPIRIVGDQVQIEFSNTSLLIRNSNPTPKLT
jgi:nitrite reductase (NADH) small subunit